MGIAEQIDFDKSITDSLIANSIALVDSDYGTVIDDSEEKWSIKPSLAEKMVDKWLSHSNFAQKLLKFVQKRKKFFFICTRFHI